MAKENFELRTDDNWFVKVGHGEKIFIYLRRRGSCWKPDSIHSLEPKSFKSSGLSQGWHKKHYYNQLWHHCKALSRTHADVDNIALGDVLLVGNSKRTSNFTDWTRRRCCWQYVTDYKLMSDQPLPMQKQYGTYCLHIIVRDEWKIMLQN